MMKIIKPLQFSPAYGAVIYGIEGADPDTVIDVDVLDCVGDDEPLGVKRFANGDRYRVNVANYYRRNLSPKPFFSRHSGFYHTADREVRSEIKVEEIRSGEVCLTAGVKRGERGSKLSNSPSVLEISPNRFDEISFYAPNAVAKATVKLRGALGETELSLGTVHCDEVIETFLLNVSDVAQRLDNEMLSGYSAMSLIIELSDGAEIVQEYRIVSTSDSSVRVGWLNPFGGIDYYTFSGVVEESVSASKKRLYSADGYRVVCSSADSHWSVSSKSEPKATMRWLAEIISSPKVWVVEQSKDGECDFREVDVLTQTAPVSSELPVWLSLRLRAKSKQIFQNG